MSADKKEARWYIIQTYSGKEDSVKANVEQRIQTLDMQDQIFQLLIPMEKEPQIDPKTGKQKEKTNKETGVTELVYKDKNIYPGYVFVEMIDNEQSWWVIRNTPGVTGFLGSSGNKARPTPVPESEIEPILKRCGIVKEIPVNFQINDEVTIIGGSYKDQVGTVVYINEKDRTVIVDVEFMGRVVSTPPIDFAFVRKNS